MFASGASVSTRSAAAAAAHLADIAEWQPIRAGMFMWVKIKGEAQGNCLLWAGPLVGAFAVGDAVQLCAGTVRCYWPGPAIQTVVWQAGNGLRPAADQGSHVHIGEDDR